MARFRRDEDDRDDYRPAKSGSNAVLLVVLALAGGFVVLVVAGGVALFLFRAQAREQQMVRAEAAAGDAEVSAVDPAVKVWDVPLPAPAEEPDPPKPPEPAPMLDIRQFLKTRSDNQARAEVEYGGKRFRITGTVYEILADGAVRFGPDAKTNPSFDALLFMTADAAAGVKRGKATFEAEYTSFDPLRLPAFSFREGVLISQP